MSEGEILVGLSVIVIGGVGAQWLARVLRVPSVLLLLAAGFVAGSVTDLVNPDELLGELLFPGVSLAVGMLLFDGGLQLDIRRIYRWRSVVTRLVTVGVLITWVVASVSAMLVTDLTGGTAWLAGAILVVSGPTVVLPILQRVRPAAPSGEILEWEGILIDPIGAMLGVIVLDYVIEDGGAGAAVGSVATTVIAGSLAGLAGAALVVLLLRHPATLQSLAAPVALAIAVAAFVSVSFIADEGGLFATTIMGVALANQRVVDIKNVAMFEEGIGILALGTLFMVLGARVSPNELGPMIVPGLVVLAALVLVARPLTVLASTWGSGLDRGSVGFLNALAPRGIVAAATSAAFALELESHGFERESEVLVPLTFVIIVGAGFIYGLGAGPAARLFGVAPTSAAPNAEAES